MSKQEQIDSKEIKQELVRIFDMLKNWRHEDEEKKQKTCRGKN